MKVFNVNVNSKSMTPLIFTLFFLLFPTISIAVQQVEKTPDSIKPLHKESVKVVKNTNKKTDLLIQEKTIFNAEKKLIIFEQEFLKLQDNITSLNRSPDDYNELYQRLRPIIAEQTKQLTQQISLNETDLGLFAEINNKQEFQKLLTQFTTLKNLFSLRQRVFNEATEDFRALHTSSKLNGMNEAFLELSYIKLQVVIITKATLQRTLEIPLRFSKSPIDILFNVLMLIVALLVMRSWRLWAKTGLAQWRQQILSIRPRTMGRMKAARFIWYFDHTRSPIEWMIFVYFILSSVNILQIVVLKELIWVITFWLCLAAFTFKFLKTIIERSKQSLLRNINKTQYLSLKLFVWWVGLLMLFSELTMIFINGGTLFTWLETIFDLCLLPIYIFLIIKWKADIYQYIESERDAISWVKKLAQYKIRIKGFISANICLIYIVYFLISKIFLQLLSRVESGRRLTTELYRKRLISDNDSFHDSLTHAEELTNEQHNIFSQDQSYVDLSVFKFTFDIIEKMQNLSEKSHVAIIGERGLGKTTLLLSLKSTYPNSLLINCDENFDHILDSLKEQLSIEEESIKNEHIISALKEADISMIMLDNCHHLISPTAGGQRQLKRLYGLINELRGHVLWVMSFETSVWQIINALNVASGFFSHEIQLRKWTEDQISSLLDNRAIIANILPIYEHLYIPRQIADIEEETLELRNKSGIYRIIWGYADGNPAIATRAFSHSIFIKDNKALVTLPISPEVKVLESFDINTLLVLRVICQFGRVNTNDIINNLRLHGLIVNSAIATTQAQGIIENINGRYQISWYWFRVVSRFLARQNLLSC